MPATIDQVLFAIHSATLTDSPLEDLLETAYHQPGRLMDTSNLYVALYDPETRLYSFPFSVDEDDDDFTPQELRQSLTDWVRRNNRALRADAAVHKELIARGEVAYVGGHSPIWLGAPLRRGDEAIGVIVVQSYTDANRFGPNDLEILERVAAGIAPTVERVWAMENRAAAHRLKVRELEHSRDEALRASRAKSSFLANMSHELRTPLNAIIGYAELLADEHGDEGRDQDLETLARICGSARHLLRIIDDILDLSRVEAGKAVVLSEAFRLSELADDVRAMSAPLMSAATADFALVQVADGACETDRGKLLQVVMNLVANAAKFARERAITVRIGLDGADDRWVRIEVADTGDGIDPDRLEQLFEPFEQGDVATTRRHGGTGLGLAISRRYCALLGGSLSARSLPGRGSTFTIRVPARYDSD